MLALGINNLQNFLDPSSDSFILKVAFVPRESFLQAYFNDMNTLIDSRISGISSLISYFEGTKNTFELGQAGEPPTFEIDLPAKYGGVSVSIIDFSFYTQYRRYIHNFILMVAYFFFAWKMIKKLATVIHM